MPQPPAYIREKDFTENFGHETDHSALNAELDKASNSINDIRENLAILQADDGKLRPEVVTPDSISPELRSDLVAGVILDTQQLLLDAQAAGAEATAGANMATTKAAEATAAATTATNKANEAAGLAQAAATKANEASASATTASNAVNSATTKANEAAASATSANNAKTAAETAANNASASATTATSMADEAADSASTATTKADDAATSAENAASSATAAANSATTATNKAAEAAASAASVDATKQVPAGLVGYFPMKSPPPGWLKANGAAGVSRVVYVDLDAAIYCGDAENATATTGYRYTDPANPSGSRSITGEYIMIPDARAEFIRGWDDGRGVDAGRALGSAQGQGIQSHQHTLGHPTSSDWYTSYGSASIYTVGGQNQYVNARTNLNGGATGGAETRPRNVALLACIKY